MSPYLVLLCDADDTLFDFPAAQRGAFAQTMEQAGYGGRWESLLPDFSRINASLWEKLARDEIDKDSLKIERFECLAAERGLDLDIHQASRDFIEALAAQSALLPGALEAVRTWSALVRIALVTNGIEHVQRGRLAGSPIAPYIADLVVSESVGFAKPHPAMLRSALKTLGDCPPDQALMLGDNLHTDIAAARAAGVPSCWYAPGTAEPTGHHLPDFVARSYDQVTELLRDA